MMSSDGYFGTPDLSNQSWNLWENTNSNILNGITPDVAKVDLPANSFMDSMGGLKGIMGGIGTLGSAVGAIGGILNGIEQRKYQKGLLRREDERIARDRARQDKFESGVIGAWK